MISDRKLFLVVIIWPILASLISFAVKANFFVSTLLFLGAPSLLLSWNNKKYAEKALIGGMVGVPLAIVVDYIMHKTGGWFAPYSIFGQGRLFRYVVPDLIIWFFLYVYYILVYYETFLDHPKKVRFIYPSFKYLVILMGLIFLLFLWFYATDAVALNIDYFYFKFGLVFVLLPLIFTLSKLPSLWSKFAKAGAYFFYLSSIYEITGLALNQWTFPGHNHYIGFVEVFGFRFPFEEFFFWILLGALAILSFYEIFDNRESLAS